MLMYCFPGQKIETAENHAVDRTQFDQSCDAALDHERSALNAQPLNAIFALRSWSSTLDSVLSTSWFSAVSTFLARVVVVPLSRCGFVWYALPLSILPLSSIDLRWYDQAGHARITYDEVRLLFRNKCSTIVGGGGIGGGGGAGVDCEKLSSSLSSVHLHTRWAIPCLVRVYTERLDWFFFVFIDGLILWRVDLTKMMTVRLFKKAVLLPFKNNESIWPSAHV